MDNDVELIEANEDLELCEVCGEYFEDCTCGNEDDDER